MSERLAVSTLFVARVAMLVALGQSSKRVPTVFGMNASPKRAPIACWARHPVQWAGTTTLGGKGAKVVEDLGDEGLENWSVEMESAHDRVEGALFGQAAGVPADVDDPSVAAAGNHEEALVFDVDDERLVVEDEGVGLPAAV
jgi:hypothetical protein